MLALVAGGVIGRRTGEPLLLVAIVVAMPNSGWQPLSSLVAAAVPMLEPEPSGIAERARREPAAL